MDFIRKVLITEDDLMKIEEDKNEWSSKGLETGGYIFGRFYPNGLAQVTHVLDGGPKAERYPIRFSGDNENATQVKEELQKEDPKIVLLGEYHVHPWKGSPHLSEADLEELKEVKKHRPWFIVLLSTLSDFKIFNLVGKTFVTTDHDCITSFGKPVVEVPHQVVKTEVSSKRKLLDRIFMITKHDLLMRKKVLIVGLGSGGSTIAKYLGCTGIGRIILIDNEELEVANLIRHEGGIEDLGKPKVEICKRMIESHNPFTIVETYNLDVAKDFTKLEEITSEVDLIIGSSGSNRVNNLLNKISLEKRIPAIYGGVYEKASGGYVLAVKPFETACYNCLFGLTSRSYFVDKEDTERYGLNEDELHGQQGLWIDISFLSLMLSKMALAILQDEQIDYNLALYDSDLKIKKLRLARRKDCAACNQEIWIKQILHGRRSVRQRLKNLFNFRKKFCITKKSNEHKLKNS